ncbi:MAG: hypothetical protein GQ574_07020 [Crocinitomix sp.]|nr:hypothetical protein [Crocinitomix sp.]
MLLSFNGFGQTLTEKLILQDSSDSVYLKESSGRFDKDGNYCFQIKIDTLEYFITNKDTFGGLKSIRGIGGGGGGAISYGSAGWKDRSTPYYYKNGLGTRVYGTAIGKVEDFQSNVSHESISFVSTTDDSVYYHLNGHLVSSALKNPKTYYRTANDFAAFSENGNAIYWIFEDSTFQLFVNNQLIDSSKFRFIQMAINDNGDYIYAKGHKPKKKIGRYDYIFYIHANNITFDYVRTVWDYELKPNGAYYYSGDDNGTDYIAINDKLYRDLDYVSNITLLDKENFFFTFGENDKTKINVNGQVFSYNYDEILKPTMDKAGNFSCYTVIDYYLYKIVNGKKIEAPISKYGVRGVPVYISPTGSSIHYFKTDDSTYLYRDEKLLFKPISNKTQFRIEPTKFLISNYYKRGKTKNGKSLFYMEYDDKAYFVYNGELSQQTIPKVTRSYARTATIGNIVISQHNDLGYFVVQQTGEQQFMITMNNQVYQELNGVDKILDYSYFFSENGLVLYGIKNAAYYQYKLTW